LSIIIKYALDISNTGQLLEGELHCGWPNGLFVVADPTALRVHMCSVFKLKLELKYKSSVAFYFILAKTLIANIMTSKIIL